MLLNDLKGAVGGRSRAHFQLLEIRIEVDGTVVRLGKVASNGASYALL